MSGEPVRGGSATRTRVRDDVGGILILLALALTFRVIIAYLLPGSGFQNDLISFRFWASNLFTEGLHGFYTRPFLHDYTPGYLYVLWAVGGLAKLLGGQGPGDLIKIPPILADVALAYLVWTMSLELGAGKWAARLAAVIVAVNPVTWFDSVVWGQVDSFGVMFLLLGLRELWRDRPERSAFLTVIGAIIKPQLGILVPIVAAVVIRRALWPKGGYGDEAPPERRGTTTGWEWSTRGPIRIVTTGAVGLATALALAFPFGLDPVGLVTQIFKTAGGYPYLSVNAWNPWGLVSMNGAGVAANHLWVCDMVVPKAAAAIYDCPTAYMIGAVPAVVVGTVVTVAAFLAVSAWVAWRPDRRTILVGLTVLAIAFFILPTRVHERYLFPLAALGAILAGVSRRWAAAYVVSAAATFANMYFVLTTLYPNNPSISDWLGIGPWLGSTTVIQVCAIAQAAVLVFAIGELRASASRRLQDEIEASAMAGGWADVDEDAPGPSTDLVEGGPTATRPASAPANRTPAPVAALAAPLPAESDGVAPTRLWPAWLPRPSTFEVGYVGWLRARLGERPLRPDRTAGLEREGGGRLDKLDLWMVVVLAAVLLTGRIWRLGEPYQMHFDEVYHPRTGMEFLQFWRYGMPHDIYEWTHPHLAKYAMALGIEAFGEDRTHNTGELGVTVRSAAVEDRWDDARNGSRVSGDRLWVATGTEVRAYDLATRELIVAIPVPGASAVAVDGLQHQVIIGTDSGELRRVTTTSLDTARWNDVAPDAGARAMVTVDGPVRLIHATGDGSAFIVVTRGVTTDEVIDLESSGLTETGRIQLDGVTAIDDAGTGLVALGDASGVTYVDTTQATVAATVRTAGPVMGMTRVTNVDKDHLYASFISPDGPRAAVLTAPGLGGTLQLDTTAMGATGGIITLPGSSAGWVGYDLASQMVHIVGTTPDGASPTVYVIEPHANSVFEDARLPFVPATLAMDENQRYPSSDREQLLAFGAAGAVATVDVGQHAFAWRLPGVLAGVLMAVLLYVLARLLFRRREVAVFLAILIAADGMLFAQSRIGMNDAYVGLGIVAAYTIFAALWRSSGSGWKRWLAFAIGFPAIGLCLGFALASKWVAAYAIGGLGILILARSALGRVVLIGGLILATTALGYMAISVPPGQDGGNYLFLAIMVGLTLVAVIANVQHPIAWTSEEFWLATLAPGAGGVAVFLASIALGNDAKPYTLGPISVTPLEVSVGLILLSLAVYGAFIAAGRMGFGYLAAPPPPDDPASLLEPPADPPSGWLRPGAGFGIPIAYALVCLVAIPLGLYVLSYVPWALDGHHQLWPGWPADRLQTDQTLLQLTEAMYRYHNTLSSPHAASSPWWAWVFDFKPVWFYQESFAGGTSAAIYDSGNLVAWWFAIPAMAFAAWQAFRRRSTALALITIAFACQWVAWSRIDRAAFQYHYYTSLPFVFLALAYFLAELWRGASNRTWLLARLAAAGAILAPTTLWLFHRPLCGFVRVLDVNPDSQACPTLIPDFLLSGRALAIALVVGIGVLILVRLLLSFADEAEDDGFTTRESLGSRLRTAALAAIGISLAFVVASTFFDDQPLFTSKGAPVEPIALVVTLALMPIAAFVATARDARRFVVGLMTVIGFWFVLWYPNLAALPLPSAMSNSYQGLLPTYVYPFQFPVSTLDRNIAGPSLFDLGPALLLLTLTLVAAVVGYATWVWRITAAEQAYMASRTPGTGADASA